MTGREIQSQVKLNEARETCVSRRLSIPMDVNHKIRCTFNVIHFSMDLLNKPLLLLLLLLLL